MRHIECTPREMEVYITHLDKLIVPRASRGCNGCCLVETAHVLRRGHEARQGNPRDPRVTPSKTTFKTVTLQVYTFLKLQRLASWITGGGAPDQSIREPGLSKRPDPHLLGVTEGWPLEPHLVLTGSKHLVHEAEREAPESMPPFLWSTQTPLGESQVLGWLAYLTSRVQLRRIRMHLQAARVQVPRAY